MTCTHVLGLIDAGPFADYPPAHLEAAWRHARQCATCGPALEAATALTAGLAALPQLAPPPDLSAIVMARIGQIVPIDHAPAVAVTPEIQAPAGTHDWSAWATVGGLAAGLAMVLWTLVADEAPMDVTWPRVRWSAAGLIATPSTATAALGLATGLVLYVVGLFSSIRKRRRP